MKWRAPGGLLNPHVDPYFDWAESTRWRGFRRLLGQALGTGDDSVRSLRLLVQATDADAARIAMRCSQWKVAPVYQDSPLALCHFVAELPIENLAWLRQLPADLLRWELALPFRDAETAARAQAIGAFGESRDAAALRPDPAFEIAAPRRPPPKIEGTVMAVIDFGCPFMNQALLDARGNTRVAALWDQGSSPNPPRRDDGSLPPWPWADTAPRMGYGRSLSQATMNALIDACEAQGDLAVDEDEAYRCIDYLINYDDARRRVWAATHGSHVSSVAAGKPDPLMPGGHPEDKACEAQLVFVQLPALTAADSGGGSLSAQVLDAVHYVLDVCHPEARIVINLSYGSFAGPHDGSSLIEQALDEILKVRGSNLAIVLGAGNGREAACHVQRTARVDRSALLRIGLEPGDFTDTYVEAWFQPDEERLERVQARVRTAEGDWSPWIGVDEQVELQVNDDPRPVARLSFQRRVPNGGRPLLLLAMAPTDRPADDDGPLAPVGSWQVELRLAPAMTKADGDDEVRFDAWIERDDPGWLGVGVQSRFEEQRIGDADQTLSSLATGQWTVATGGFRLSDGVPARYSSTGPRKGRNLFVYAACEESADQPHVRGAAVRSGDALRMSGTSVAAPVLARRIYNHLAEEGADTVPTAGWAKVLKKIVSDEQHAAHKEGRDAVLRLPNPALDPAP